MHLVRLLLTLLLAIYANTAIVAPTGAKSSFVSSTTAIVAVDIQNDFVIGTLPVPYAKNAVHEMNNLINAFPYLPLYATQDWHKEDHVSIAENHDLPPFTYVANMTAQGVEGSFEQMLWPIHGLQNSLGAQFDPDFNIYGAIIVQKGTHSSVDSYSGFGDAFGGKYERTILHSELQQKNIDTVIIAGLATDYCVKYTVLDAIRLGYNTILYLPASRGVSPETTDAAIKEMRDAGAIIVTDLSELTSCNV
jgi:nicotinamidase/pyrazinamidase